MGRSLGVRIIFPQRGEIGGSTQVGGESAASLERRLATALERVGEATRILLRVAGAAEGLSTTQAQLLLRLANTDPSADEPARLARHLDVTRPTITDALASLEQKGLVTRAAHAADGRRRVFSLTSKGQSVVARLADWDGTLVDAVDHLPEQSRGAALRAVLDVIASLVSAGVISVARTCTTCRFFQPDVRSGGAPHHCAALEMPLQDATLRVDCPEHEAGTTRASRAGTGRLEKEPATGAVTHVKPRDRKQAVDPAAPIPLYFQLKTALLEDILGGRYGPDGRLPTEHELCAKYGISRTPAHRALAELADAGVILRSRHRGTFVNPHWLRRRADRPELRVVVPEGPWESLVRTAAPPDVTLNIASVPLPDLHQTLSHAVAEGRAPDLAVLDSVWVHEFAAAGFLWDLNELTEGWSGQIGTDLLEPFATANTHRGRIVALQAEGDVAGLWYRVDALAATMATPPRTWAELADAARAVASPGRTRPLALPGGSRAGETTTYCLLAFLASNGARVLDSGGITLNSHAAIEALEFLRSLVDDGLVAAGAVAHDWDQPSHLLADERVAMAFGGSYEARMLAAQEHVAVAELSGRYGFLPMPAGPRGSLATVAGGMVYAVFRQAAQPQLAGRLLRHLCSTEQLAQMSRKTGQIPPRASAVSLVAQESPFLVQTSRMLPTAIVRPATSTYASVSAQLQAMLEAVLTRRLSPAVAAKQAAQLIAAITGLPIRSA